MKVKVYDYQFDNLGEFIEYCFQNNIQSEISLSLLYQNLKFYGELELEVN